MTVYCITNTTNRYITTYKLVVGGYVIYRNTITYQTTRCYNWQWLWSDHYADHALVNTAKNFWRLQKVGKFLMSFWRKKRAAVKIFTTRKQDKLFFISNFCPVLNVVFFLSGDSLASEFYIPTFRNILFDPSSYVVWTRRIWMV